MEAAADHGALVLHQIEARETQGHEMLEDAEVERQGPRPASVTPRVPHHQVVIGANVRLLRDGAQGEAALLRLPPGPLRAMKPSPAARTPPSRSAIACQRAPGHMAIHRRAQADRWNTVASSASAASASHAAASGGDSISSVSLTPARSRRKAK